MYITTLAVICNLKQIRIFTNLYFIFFISILLEISHYFIPNRAFELYDLLANMIGVILIFLLKKMNFMNKHIITILILFFFQNIQASEIIGVPKVVDGDTIHIKSYKIRLEGIDAPEMRQKCKKSYLQIIFLNFQKDYYCGQISKKNLYKKLAMNL